HLLHRLAADELHHHHPVPVLKELVDGGDAWVIEAGDGGRLGPEPLGVVEIRVEEFDRDFTIERFVDGAIHAAHPAAGEVLEQPVLTELTSDHSAWVGAPLKPYRRVEQGSIAASFFNTAQEGNLGGNRVSGWRIFSPRHPAASARGRAERLWCRRARRFVRAYRVAACRCCTSC